MRLTLHCQYRAMSFTVVYLYHLFTTNARYVRPNVWCDETSTTARNMVSVALLYHQQHLLAFWPANHGTRNNLLHLCYTCHPHLPTVLLACTMWPHMHGHHTTVVCVTLRTFHLRQTKRQLHAQKNSTLLYT